MLNKKFENEFNLMKIEKQKQIVEIEKNSLIKNLNQNCNKKMKLIIMKKILLKKKYQKCSFFYSKQ